MERQMATAELVELGIINIKLGDFLEVGDGPKGTRLVVEVREASGERTSQCLVGHTRRRGLGHG